MTMPRCSYRHKDFANKDVYRGDGTDQCWLDETGNFGTNQAPDFRCIFHAPANLEPIDRQDWPCVERGKYQANLLKALLVKWRVLNTKRKAQNQKPLAFVLPGLSCGDIDLQRFVFSGNFICSHATFTGYANFDSVTFTGHANFYSATFTGYANFYSATFTGYANFYSATFTGYTNFEAVTFDGKADFTQAKFITNANFYETTFTVTGFAFFFKARFCEESDFRRSTFAGYANFDSAVFTGEAKFKRVTFSGKVDSSKLTFKGKLLLQNCQFANPTTFTACSIHNLQYVEHTGARVKFNQCEILQENNNKLPCVWNFENQDCSLLSFMNMDLSHAIFLGAILSGSRFDSCTWPGEPDEYAKVHHHNDILNHGDRSQLRLLNALYQQLKKNLEDARNYRQAGDFHYREMEVWQRLLQGQGLSLDRAILRCYCFVGDFGENYLKLFKRLVFSILFATGLVTVSESLINGKGIATLIQLFSVLPDRFQDGQLGVTLFDLANRLLSDFYKHFQEVFLGLIPSPFQRNAFDAYNYHFVSKFMIVIEGLVLVTLSVLFVMAIRRRFRR